MLWGFKTRNEVLRVRELWLKEAICSVDVVVFLKAQAQGNVSRAVAPMPSHVPLRPPNSIRVHLTTTYHEAIILQFINYDGKRVQLNDRVLELCTVNYYGNRPWCNR